MVSAVDSCLDFRPGLKGRCRCRPRTRYMRLRHNQTNVGRGQGRCRLGSFLRITVEYRSYDSMRIMYEQSVFEMVTALRQFPAIYATRILINRKHKGIRPAFASTARNGRREAHCTTNTLEHSLCSRCRDLHDIACMIRKNRSSARP